MEKPDQYLTPFQQKLRQKSRQDDLPKSYRQQLQIMLLVSKGKFQTEMHQTLAWCLATARHWAHITRSSMVHQWQNYPIGQPKAANEEYLDRLKKLLSYIHEDYGYSFRCGQ